MRNVGTSVRPGPDGSATPRGCRLVPGRVDVNGQLGRSSIDSGAQRDLCSLRRRGAVRARIDHPVIDSDGHLIEYLPLVRDFLVEEAGETVATGFDAMIRSAFQRSAVPDPTRRRQLGIHAAGVWGIPTENTLDRATAMLPQLHYRRLEELGIDFAVLYPTYGLTVTALPNEELRRALARALNRYYAEAYRVSATGSSQWQPSPPSLPRRRWPSSTTPWGSSGSRP